MSPGLLDMISPGKRHYIRYMHVPTNQILARIYRARRCLILLLHSFNDSNIRTIFSFNNHKQPNPKIKSNQINNHTKNKNKVNNKSCPSSADYVSAPHVTISSKEFLPPISKSNVKSAAPQIPVSSSFPSLPSSATSTNLPELP